MVKRGKNGEEMLADAFLSLPLQTLLCRMSAW